MGWQESDTTEQLSLHLNIRWHCPLGLVCETHPQEIQCCLQTELGCLSKLGTLVCSAAASVSWLTGPKFPCSVRRGSQLRPSALSSTESESESHSVVSDSLRSHGLYSPWNSPGQNTEVGSLSLLQGIFPTQGWNPGLPHYRVLFPV